MSLTMDLFIIRFSTQRVPVYYKNISRAIVFYFDIKNVAQSQGPILPGLSSDPKFKKFTYRIAQAAHRIFFHAL